MKPQFFSYKCQQCFLRCCFVLKSKHVTYNFCVSLEKMWLLGRSFRITHLKLYPLDDCKQQQHLFLRIFYFESQNRAKTGSIIGNFYSIDHIAEDHTHTNITCSIEEPQQKYRIGTVSNRLLAGLNPLASAVIQNVWSD